MEAYLDMLIGALCYAVIQGLVGFLNDAIKKRRSAIDSMDYYIDFYQMQIRSGYAEIVEETAAKMPDGVLKRAATAALFRYENRL